MNKYAVIVDLNGTLVNTEVAFYLAYKDVLSSYNIPFTLDQFTSNWSTKGKKLKDYLIEIKREDLLIFENKMLDMKNKIFHDTLEERATLMPGSRELISLLVKNNIKIGLESSTTIENINKILNHFQIENMFNEISSGDMIIDEQRYGYKKNKSSRLKSLADRLGIECSNCIVIGDAEKDIKGAKDAGMRAIAVPNQYTKNNNFSMSDKIIKTLEDVTLGLFFSLNEVQIKN